MKYAPQILASCILAIGLASSFPNAFGYTQATFEENFDGALNGWKSLLCLKHINDIDGRQSCSIGQSVISNPGELNKDAKSSPYWGYIQIKSTYPKCIEKTHDVRYQKTFDVTVPDIYDVSAWIATSPCPTCKLKTSHLYIDGEEILSQKASSGIPVLEKSKIDLNPGTHTITIRATTDRACTGEFRSSFDNIRVERAITQDEYNALEKARAETDAKDRADAAAEQARADAATEKARADAATEKARADAAAEKARVDDSNSRIQPPVREDLTTDSQPQSKVTICHIPNGNSVKPQTITISQSGLEAHQKHGDYPGTCLAEEPYNSPTVPDNDKDKNLEKEIEKLKKKVEEQENSINSLDRIISEISQFVDRIRGFFL